MTLDHRLGPLQFELDGEVYDLLDLGGGRVKWQSQTVPGQPGDSTQVKYAPIEMHGGFGATHRIRRGNGTPSDPSHHAYAENVSAQFEGVTYPAPRITYVEGVDFAPQRRAFRIGGYPASIVGGDGAGVGAVGGGSSSAPPQFIREFGTMLYVHCDTYTLVLDPEPDVPVFVEARHHGEAARARSSDLFGGDLFVALGSALDAEVATQPYSSGSPTIWDTVEVPRTVYAAGVGGRLFSSLGGKVYNVLPGQDGTLSINYLPSNGETITDESDPVRSLVEFSSALVAGTARAARTLDPNRGYQGVPLMPESRLSASEFDGRALLSIGPVLFYGTTRGVEMFVAGQPGRAAGPELLHHNNTPYKGMQWGVPDYLGNWMAWPAYIPETGDSVVFLARLRDDEDSGTGPVAWHDVLYLSQRECRCVRLWGGTPTRKPRLFFGAASAASKYQVGWIDLGADGGPDPFTTDGQPAVSGFIETPLDDLGLPGVNKNIERVEVPFIHHADADNYITVAARAGHDGSLVNLVTAQGGSDRIDSEGFARVFAPTGEQVMSQEVSLRFTFTQDEAATDWLMMHGTPTLAYTEVPDETQAITVVVDARTTDIREAELVAAALRALVGTGHVRQQYGPDGADRWVKVTSANVAVSEVAGGSAKGDTNIGIEVVLREVMVN